MNDENKLFDHITYATLLEDPSLVAGMSRLVVAGTDIMSQVTFNSDSDHITVSGQSNIHPKAKFSSLVRTTKGLADFLTDFYRNNIRTQEDCRIVIIHIFTKCDMLDYYALKGTFKK